MDDDPRQHLSQMATAWTLIRHAHEGTATGADDARCAVLDRYAPAIYRYLLGAVRDRDRADDLFQEFALKFLRGDLHRADPERGRFRDYLKTTLYHLVAREQGRRRPAPLTIDVPDPEVVDSEPADDEGFLEVWKEVLIQRAWSALEQREAEDGRPTYTVLRFRTDHPELDSQAAAEVLSVRLGRPVSSAWVRKWVHQARRQFAAGLCEEVACSIEREHPTEDEIEQELQSLGWLDTCREALRERSR